MVLCKFFQQGTCRYGQYCKFEHTYPNRGKAFNNNEDKNVALLVAEEILAAERGGQWLLSCYGPFKEKRCIPGMEDVSPEEIRWEMYQGQKAGNVDQINAQFQQMCEAMKVKREALKNPTTQIYQMLEEIQNSGSENKTNFAFATSQLGTTNSNQAANAFGQKTLPVQNNPFGGNSTFNATQSSSSIFNKPANNTATVFGGNTNFGGPSVFGGGSTAGASIFGGASKTSMPFGSVQNAQNFGAVTQGTSNSIFGGSNPTQVPGFGQSATFGATAMPGNSSQTSNAFLKPQDSQGFGGSTSSNVFGGAVSNSGSAFGVNVNTATPTTNNVFGPSVSTGAAFGGVPVFGGATAFNTTQASASVFGQPALGGTVVPSSSSAYVFGGNNPQSALTFDSLPQNTPANTYNLPAQSVNTFEVAPNASPFNTTPVLTSNKPFSTVNSTSVFAPSVGGAGNFNQTSNTFGLPASSTNVFGVSNVTTTQSAFQPTTGPQTQLGPSEIAQNQYSASTNATFNATNAFGVKSSPFTATSANQSNPFGTANSKPGSTNVFGVAITIDETAYSANDCLTDDEKAAYMSETFKTGYIPLKPPTRELS